MLWLAASKHEICHLARHATGWSQNVTCFGKKNYAGETLENNLFSQGIHVQTGSMSGLGRRAPFAYKDIDQVIDVVQTAGIAKKVARLKPCVVIKG